VTCPRGCTALCGPKDACYAACGKVEVDKSYARITLKIDSGDSKEIASLLTRHSGRNVKFIPDKVKEKARYSFDLNNDPVWNALKFFAKYGTVTVDGTNFRSLEKLRRRMLKGERLSVNFTNVPVGDAVAKLSFLSGLPFSVESGDTGKLLSISLEEVTLNEIVARISAQTGVKINQARRRA